jgi:hypothetical protein
VWWVRERVALRRVKGGEVAVPSIQMSGLLAKKDSEGSKRRVGERKVEGVDRP